MVRSEEKAKVNIINGWKIMAYETKVLLIAIAEIICKARTLKEAYSAIAKMTNAEGVLLKPYDEAKAELSEAD